MHSPFTTHHSLLSIRRRAASGFTLIEILIAIFVFVVGVLGILSMFPVAMNSASRAMGQVRGNILAQSVLSQLTADCKVVYEEGTLAAIPVDAYTLVRSVEVPAADSRVNYYVTMTDGLAKWQSRRIVADTDAAILNGDLDTIAVDPLEPGFSPLPAAGDPYVITRLGLPDAPVTGAPPEFGLERDFYVRRIIDENTIEIGRRDTLEPTDGVVTAHSANTLTDDTKNWTAGIYENCTVLLTAGTGAGQQRQIQPGNTPDTLTVAPDWDVQPADDDTEYEILSINPVKHFPETGVSIDAVAGSLALVDSAAPWPPNELVDHLVRITSGAGAGQVRRIRSNTADTLTVASPWSEDIDGALSAAPSSYEIGWPNLTLAGSAGTPEGFLVVTSGRASGRVYMITGSSDDAVTGGEGHQIRCSGADLDLWEVGVTEARVPLQKGATPAEYLNNDAYKYKPSNATTVTIIGNTGHLKSVLPVAQDRTLRKDEVDPLEDEINVFGDTNKTQTQYDVYGMDADNDGYADEYGSEYSAVAIFGDSGTLIEGPVRVDVLVFRNYNNEEDPADNRKPVGFLTGYIGRP